MQEVHHTLFHIKLQLHTKEKVKVELLWFHFENTIMRLLLKLSRDIVKESFQAQNCTSRARASASARARVRARARSTILGTCNTK